MSGEPIESYMSRSRHRWIAVIIIIAITIAISAYSVCVMSFDISFSETWEYIIRHLEGIEPENYYDRIRDELVFYGTVPRVVAASLIGAILGISGAVMQYCVRNPLADPYTTGISSAALFGVTISLALGIVLIPLPGKLGIVLNAFIFAMVPCILMIIISVKRKTTPTMLILIGIAMMYIFSSFTMVLKYNAEPEVLDQIIGWSIGSVSMAQWDSIPFLIIALIILLIMTVVYSGKLDVMSTGDNLATSLGADPKRTRLICMAVVSACTAVAVSFSGSIGFVGLVVPHVARLFVGSRTNALIPCSAVAGAFLLIAADTLARSFGAGLPVGAVTAIIGSPVFLYFLVKMRTSGWGN